VDNVIFALLVLIGVAMSVLTFFRPTMGFVVVLVMFPFEVGLQSFKPALILSYPWAVNVGVALVAGLAAGLCFTQRKRPLAGLSNPATWLFVGLYGWMLSTFFWTPTFEAAMYFLKLGWPYMVLLYFISPLLISSIEDLDEIIRPFMILSSLVAICVFLNPRAGFLSGRLTIDLGYVAGVGEINSNPLALSELGAMLAIVAGLYRGRTRSVLMLAFQVVAFTVGMGFALAAGSRGQVLAAAGVCVVGYPLLAERKNFMSILTIGIGGIIVSAVIATLYLFLFSGVEDTRWSGTAIEQGAGDRLGFITGLLEGYTGQPAFWIQGLGASGFNQFFRAPESAFPFHYPHNIFVESLAEYGLIGLALLMGICFVCAKQWSRLYRAVGKDNNTRSLCTILLALAIFQFLMSLKQGALLNAPLLFTFTLIVGKLATRAKGDEHGQPADVGGPDDEEIEKLQIAYAEGDPRRVS